jgi:hypothetical protein
MYMYTGTDRTHKNSAELTIPLLLSAHGMLITSALIIEVLRVKEECKLVCTRSGKHSQYM